MRASCTGTSFRVLKLLDFTSFEDTESIPWDKAKETLLRLATTPPPSTARICFLMEYEGFLIGAGSRNDRWFYIDVQGSPQAPSAGALYTEFSTPADFVEVVLLPDGLAPTATSPNEAQSCRIWTVTVRAKILPGTVAKHTLGRCTVQDFRRKLTEDCAVITPMLQSAHIITTPADVHEVLRTLSVVQKQPVAPPTLQAPLPPSISSDSSAQIVRLGNNVQEYQKAYNASIADHWFCLCGKKLSRSVRPSSSTFEQHCKTSQENRPRQPRERTLLTFFPAKRSSGNPSLQSTPTMPTGTSTPITEQSVVPTELPLPPPPCPKVLPFGIKDANHLRRAYPLLRHGHEKASWRLVDGLGLESVDPPCPGRSTPKSHVAPPPPLHPHWKHPLLYACLCSKRARLRARHQFFSQKTIGGTMGLLRRSNVSHKRADWPHNPWCMGGLQCFIAGDKITSGPKRWIGYITPLMWGVPNASKRGTKTKVSHKGSHWVHKPCRMGAPRSFKAGN